MVSRHCVSVLYMASYKTLNLARNLILQLRGIELTWALMRFIMALGLNDVEPIPRNVYLFRYL